MRLRAKVKQVTGKTRHLLRLPAGVTKIADPVYLEIESKPDGVFL